MFEFWNDVLRKRKEIDGRILQLQTQIHSWEAEINKLTKQTFDRDETLRRYKLEHDG